MANVTTGSASDITGESAVLHGNVPDADGLAITARGFEYGIDTSYGQTAEETGLSTYSFATQWGTDQTLDGNFNNPEDVAVDSSGNVYVVDTSNNRIQKFDSNGNFIMKWGSHGSVAGKFSYIGGITVDSNDNVYAVDTNNHRIQKFDSSGTFVTMWGSEGSGDGQLSGHRYIAVDSSGNLYVADAGNSRIQKFDSDGNFLTKWGAWSCWYNSGGATDGNFCSLRGVAIDDNDNVYVTENNRIQKFNSNGTFLAKSGNGQGGSNDGQFVDPHGITVDSAGNVYVVDYSNQRVQKFDSSFDFILKFGTDYGADGNFRIANGIALDASSNIYVVDSGNSRIQKFDSDGNFITKWGSLGSGNGQFNIPKDVAIDASGDVYTTDSSNNRIQKFDSSGNFITKWGSNGSGDGQFVSLEGIATDPSNNIYVVDVSNNRIQKFDSSGSLIAKWGSADCGYSGDWVDGSFCHPSDITSDPSGNIYVTNGNIHHRVQKFDQTSTFLTKWGTWGSGDGQLSYPSGITTDFSGSIYVADSSNNRIQKFDSNGTFITKWGSYGSADGQFSYPWDVAADSFGNIYVTDGNRVQKFQPVFNEGEFTEGISGLECGTTYHYRAFAVNSSDTVYGEDQTFTTTECPPPPVTNDLEVQFEGAETCLERSDTSRQFKAIYKNNGSETVKRLTLNVDLEGFNPASITGMDFGGSAITSAFLDGEWQGTIEPGQQLELSFTMDLTHNEWTRGFFGGWGYDKHFDDTQELVDNVRYNNWAFIAAVFCDNMSDFELEIDLEAPGLVVGQEATYVYKVTNLGTQPYTDERGVFLSGGTLIPGLQVQEFEVFDQNGESVDVACGGSADGFSCLINDFDTVEVGDYFEARIVVLVEEVPENSTVIGYAGGMLEPDADLYYAITELNSQEDLGLYMANALGSRQRNSVATYTGTGNGSPGGNDEDQDSDTISDEIEHNAPNNGDGNNDGTPDGEQAHVVSLVSSVTGKYVTVALAEECSVTSVSIVGEDENAKDDSKYVYNNGLVRFAADCGEDGFTTPVSIYHYNIEEDDFSVRKYHPADQSYFTIEEASLSQQTIGGQPVVVTSYEITDGQQLDVDGEENGTIVDPVGLASADTTGGLAHTGMRQSSILYVAVAITICGIGVYVKRRRFTTANTR